MNEVLEVIKRRRSVRKYKAEQISGEALEKILEAAVYAPSANNRQPWHFTVIQDAQLLNNINNVTRRNMEKSDEEWVRKTGSNPGFRVTYDAPALIVVSGRKDVMTAKVDCSAAIQNILVAAESMNIGSVWLGLVRYFFQDEEELSALKIPEGYEPFYGVALGYNANEESLPAPKRNMEVINYIR